MGFFQQKCLSLVKQAAHHTMALPLTSSNFKQKVSLIESRSRASHKDAFKLQTQNFP